MVAPVPPPDMTNTSTATAGNIDSGAVNWAFGDKTFYNGTRSNPWVTGGFIIGGVIVAWIIFGGKGNAK